MRHLRKYEGVLKIENPQTGWVIAKNGRYWFVASILRNTHLSDGHQNGLLKKGLVSRYDCECLTMSFKYSDHWR